MTGMSPELRAALDRIRGHVMTAAEVFEQRVSFVWSGQKHSSGNLRTKDDIRKMLLETQGAPAQATDLCRAALHYARSDNPDLTVRQLALLGLVCDEPGHSTGTYAGLLTVSKPVITRAKATLAALGLLTCRPRPDDARRLMIEPTPSGTALRLSMKDLPA